MYDRVYNGRTLSFEASGGLIHSSLVMQDFETDSYWAMMTGQSIAGELKGTQLVELPVGKKVQWLDWVAEHPETLVLSVRGAEDGFNPYADYFASPDGFSGTHATDKRLRTKEPIFAFHLGADSYAVTHDAAEGGRTFSTDTDTDTDRVFLYRTPSSHLFSSTAAFLVPGDLVRQDGAWTHPASGCAFDPAAESFGPGTGEVACPQRLSGFDTFWYNWSLNNPHTVLLTETGN